ncbi:hypothetical protein [Pseudomonas sp. F(2018)]|uniref:hypothetical protein n=1 Tax=Pseudomonas sp. F(2018) TaxID=2502240 RepID=UPI0010F62BD8|nr:hypothetical protein [Pseudomonas sp. F(2018)]
MTENKEKEVWVVWQNTDLTEGRGHEVPILVCETKSTALRMAKKQGVQGSDASVTSFKATHINGHWCAPVVIVKATKADQAAEQSRIQFESVLEKAKALGLSPEELQIIARPKP